MLPLTDKGFVEELKKELGQEHSIFEKSIYAVEWSDSNDDVLSLLCGDSRGDVYRIYHLTYSNKNKEGYPRYEEFVGIQAVKECSFTAVILFKIIFYCNKCPKYGIYKVNNKYSCLHNLWFYWQEVMMCTIWTKT